MARRKRPPKPPGLVRPIAGLAAAAALGGMARGSLADADEKARALIYGRRTPMLDATLPALTDLGSTYAVAGASAALWSLGRKRLAREVAMVGGIAWMIAQAAKPLYKRARPYDAGAVELHVRRPAGLSYPSGHPAVAAAITRVLDRDVHGAPSRVIQRIPRMVAFSRVYVGAHYPTDVIGGLLIGRAVGDLWVRYAKRAAGGI